MSPSDRIERALGIPVTSIRSLSGGMIGQVYRSELADGRSVVAKVADADGTLEIEGYMLRYLADHSRAPVPRVLASQPDLLVMDSVPGRSGFDAQSQRHAAEVFAELHSHTQQHFGLERDTLIGSLHQPNPLTASWIDFFRDHRLLYMADVAYQAGRLPSALRQRIDKLAQQLERWLQEPDQPALIHGDAWTNNILAADGRITGLIDPAIYYAHPEIELAFTTLFGTFGQPFFERYHALRPIAPGFFEVRRDIYNLYPLLVHVRLFGGGYVSSVDSILRVLGC